MGYKGVLFRYTKSVVLWYWDSSGKRVRMEPLKKMTRNVEISDAANDFLRKYVRFIMGNNGYMSDAAKLYLSTSGKSQRGIAELMPGLDGVRTPVSTVTGNIQRSKDRLEADFDDDMLTQIIDYGVSDLSKYDEQLRKASERLVERPTRLSQLGIKLPDTMAKRHKLTNEQFMEFTRTISPYTKRQMEFVANNVDERALEYARYILLGIGEMNEEDAERRELLVGMLE